MSFDEYWAAVVAKYPHLAKPEGRVAVRVSSLRDLMAQAHARGVEHGRLAERGAEMLKKAADQGSPFSAFESIFGKPSQN